MILVIDAAAELSTPWRRQSAPVERAAFAAMDAGGPQVRVVCVTTGAGDGDDEVANHWNARGTQAANRVPSRPSHAAADAASGGRASSGIAR